MPRLCALLTALILALAYPSGVSARDGAVLAPEALKPLTRPPAAFDHDPHNEQAGLEDCLICHHGGENGVQDPEDNTAGIPCAECHPVKTDSGTPLMRAYHRQCLDCHEKEKKGPLTCGGCHTARRD